MFPSLARPALAAVARMAVAAAFCTVAAAALAQAGGPPASVLPGLAAVPKPPADLRLPGPDPRDCGTSPHSALCAVGRWAQFARMEVALKAGAFQGTYAMERPANGEVLTTYAERTPGGRRGGEVLLLADDAFAYRTREQLPTDDDILDYMLAAPNMAMQLVAVLLDEGVLGGPADVTGRVALAASEPIATLPIGAVRTEAGQSYIWTIEGGKLARRIVVLGRRDEAAGRVEIRTPLPATAPVLASRFDNLKDGAPALVKAPTSSQNATHATGNAEG